MTVLVGETILIRSSFQVPHLVSIPGPFVGSDDFHRHTAKSSSAANAITAIIAAIRMGIANTKDRRGATTSTRRLSLSRATALIVANDSRKSVTSSEHSGQSSRCNLAVLRSNR